MLMANGLSNEA